MKKKRSRNNFSNTLEIRLKKIRNRKILLGITRNILITAVAIYLMFGMIFGISVVEGESMEPNLKSGDIVLFYRLGVDYASGDIVLADVGEEYNYVKRIAALPGQTVDIANGHLLINGEEEQEPYIYEETIAKTGCSLPITLNEDEYFILGDHRENSVDSRNFGPVNKSNVKGLVIAVFRISLYKT